MKTKIKYGEIFAQLTKRHLLVFFRNKVRIFFTLMVPFIVFAIYVFFLRDLEFSTVNSVLAEIDGSGALSQNKELTSRIAAVVDSWMLSGIIAISTITVSLQTNSTIVADKENGVNRDFASSPISRNLLIASYFVFNIIVTVMICFVFLLVCLIYLACMGEFVLGFTDFLTIFATLVYTSVSSVMLTVFICSFIKRDSTMASVNTIFSTVIGFLIGAYMPFATMPSWVENVCMFFPGTYSCAMLRYSFMSAPITELTNYLSASGIIPNSGELVSELMQSFGYNLRFFGHSVGIGVQALVVALSILVFLVANIVSANQIVTVIGVVGKKIKKKK